MHYLVFLFSPPLTSTPLLCSSSFAISPLPPPSVSLILRPSHCQNLPSSDQESMFPNDLPSSPSHISPKHTKRSPIELVIYTPATVLDIQPKAKPSIFIPNEFWVCCCSYTPGRQLSVCLPLLREGGQWREVADASYDMMCSAGR